MNVYAHLKYQEALEEAIEQRRKLPGKWTLRQMAESVGLQPSFLTNVMKRRFDFNADQLYAVAEYLGFGTNERRYLLLLLDYQRSANKTRKAEIKSEIDEIRRQNQKTEKHLQSKVVEQTTDALAEYYLDPFVQLVHVHLELPAFSAEPERLCTALGLSKPQLAKVLSVLIRLGYVRMEGKKYKVTDQYTHLPKEAPLCGPHQAMMRLKSIDQLQRLSDDQKYSFSLAFAATDETKEQIREAFFAFLKKAESIYAPAPSKKAFQMNFDLFAWEI